MRNVLLLSGALNVSGSTTWIMNLHRGLIDAGANVVHLVVSAPTDMSPDFGRFMYTGRARSSVKLRIWRWGRLHKFFPKWYEALEEREYSKRVERSLRKLGWEGKVDLVIKDFTSYLPQALARYSVVAVIHQVLSFSWGTRLQEAALQRAKFFVPVSKVAGSDAKRLGLRVIDPIYNPIDADYVRGRAEDFKPQFERPYIVYVGRLVDAKGVHDLLLAFSRMASQLDLVYVGDGDEMRRLKETARSLGLESRVHFVGFQDNPYPFIKHANLLVLPSRSEAMPYVPIEAGVLGVRLVLAGFDAAHEFFDSSVIMETGPEEQFVEQLAGKIEAALSTVNGGGLRMGVLENLSPRSVARKYLSLIGKEEGGGQA